MAYTGKVVDGCRRIVPAVTDDEWLSGCLYLWNLSCGNRTIGSNGLSLGLIAED
jgi:hypothetical protein